MLFEPRLRVAEIVERHYHAEMLERRGRFIADGLAVIAGDFFGRVVRNDVMAEEIEVNAVRHLAAFGAFENFAVELARAVEIVNGK